MNSPVRGQDTGDGGIVTVDIYHVPEECECCESVRWWRVLGPIQGKEIKVKLWDERVGKK